MPVDVLSNEWPRILFMRTRLLSWSSKSYSLLRFENMIFKIWYQSSFSIWILFISAPWASVPRSDPPSLIWTKTVSNAFSLKIALAWPKINGHGPCHIGDRFLSKSKSEVWENVVCESMDLCAWEGAAQRLYWCNCLFEFIMRLKPTHFRSVLPS